MIVATHTRDETIHLFEQCLNLLNSFPNAEVAHKQVSHVEMRWIVSECWNTGVYYFKCSKHEKAEKWLGLAMNLSVFIDEGDVALHTTLHKSYSSVLEKIRCAKAK